MKRPKFTEDQQQWLCEQIDFWYGYWKHIITDTNGTHRLGVAKEELKTVICGMRFTHE